MDVRVRSPTTHTLHQSDVNIHRSCGENKTPITFLLGMGRT
jgi:hypothetical protein